MGGLSALMHTELRERVEPGYWKTNGSLSREQVSHKHCQLERFRQEVR